MNNTLIDTIDISESRVEFFTNLNIINSIHTPFTGYVNQGNEVIIESEKLNDEYRFINLGDGFFKHENLSPYFDSAVDELLIWLISNCWSKNFVHGDLTDDNLILRAGTDGRVHICIIDWFDFGDYYSGDEAIYRILLDIFDVLSSLAKSIGINWRYVPSETITNHLHVLGSLNLVYKGYNIFNLLAEEIKIHDLPDNVNYTSYLKDTNGNYLPKIQMILEWANETIFKKSGGRRSRIARKNNTRKKKRDKKIMNKKKPQKKINTKKKKQSKKKTMKKRKIRMLH